MMIGDKRKFNVAIITLKDGHLLLKSLKGLVGFMSPLASFFQGRTCQTLML